MGFGSLVTAIYSQKMINEATINASHGDLNPGKANMSYFNERLGFHCQIYRRLHHLLPLSFQQWLRHR